MKTTYDPHTDTVVIELRPGPVAESAEDKPGVILDYDADGNLVSIEVLDTSTRIPEADQLGFEVTA